MSADLFAEFGNNPSPSPPPPPPPQPQPQPHQQQFKPDVSSRGPKERVSKDAFDLGFKSNLAAATASPIEQWPSLSGDMNSWTIQPTVSQTVHAAPQASNDDDDGWGDFETAEPVAPPLSKAFPGQFGGFTAFPTGPEQNGRVRAPTIDLMTNTLVDVRHKPGAKVKPAGDSSWDSPQERLKLRMKSTPSDPNVLFDADDFELQEGEEDDDNDDDNFGDFEMVTPTPSQPKAETVPAPLPASDPSALLDLLSLDDAPQQPPQAENGSTRKQPPSQLLGALSFGAAASQLPIPPKSPSFQERNPFPDLEIRTTTAAVSVAARRVRDDPISASPVTAWPTIDRGANSASGWQDDEDWGAWDDIPSSGGNINGDVDSADPPDSWDWSTSGISEPVTTKANDNDPPPINVPPPSVILSIFPDLLNSGSSLFRPISGQNASIKQQILSNPKAVQFLQGYVLLAATAARVIAGRKHRWHRDKMLVKSMSISAAGSKGMKLAGIDKTQSVREDREAADVAAVWCEHVGRLRSAVAAANAAGKAGFNIPELSENLLVQTAKMVPTSPKACIVCGLKREERVSKVDYDVEDSFGEWWVEHWGHRSCKNFWVEHEQKLRQR